MAALNAPATAQHGAQRLQLSSAPSFAAPRPRVNHALQSVTPTPTSSPPVDCRWKRGRPVTFSSGAFGTKPADHVAETSNTIRAPATPGSAVQAHDQNVEAPRGLPQQNYKRHRNTATVDEQDVFAGDWPDVTRRNDVHTQTDRIVDGVSLSKDAPATNATLSSTVDSAGREHGNQQDVASMLARSTAPPTSGDGVMEDVSDIDYMPTSSDESEIKSEQVDSDVEEADEEPSETHTPLEFQIPEDVLRAAMTAPENTKASFWSSTLYRGPEDVPVLVHYCKTKEVSERVAKHFVNEPVVGFDIEWKPYSSPDSIKKNVSLIQLACEDRIALFHIALFHGSTAAQLLPPTLKAILESPDIYKVGVAVKGDFSRVSKFLKVEPQGVYELSRLHNLVENYATNPSKVNNKLVALAPQVQKHLQLPLYKGGHLIDDPEDLNNVRSSDWSLPLNSQQIHYAAADAYAGFRLFDVLEEKRKQLKPTPSRPLACDYDSKPKPRSTVSKPRKKRMPAVKDKEATIAVAEGPVAAAEQTSEPEGEAEEKPEPSQETEGYETAQEDLLDSHQLEGEGPAEDSYESTDDAPPDSEPSLENKEVAPAADVSQRRVGRINLSRLRGPDPGYPELPSHRGSDEADSTSDEDLIDFSDRLNEVKFDRERKAAEVSEEATDEFDDSELEEALQGLSIDSDGNLQGSDAARIEQDTASEPQDSVAEDDTETKKMEPLKKADFEASPALMTDDLATDKEEQRPIDLINDFEVANDVHDPPISAPAPAASVSAFQMPTSEPSTPAPVAPTESSSEHAVSNHTPEYSLATTWARSYLSSTIPPPGSLVPSHIRATVPHLRAYHMWHHQHLPLDEIARQVRDPPLAASTVASYVLQAITLERMDFDASAVRGVLMEMPEALRRGKWRALAEKVGSR
ncbi:hypothetical protein E8E12_003717 [Didymella heteroderae]|uniref:3'-5' exonuclease domain-containing protein n=1 Tax=Didymella heteroderae TaxID=1769908 RepID=A0A9P5BWB3_9PLEO|nr:hypothetical protein E8E12_003717 [Didymella heteroderae]